MERYERAKEGSANPFQGCNDAEKQAETSFLDETADWFHNIVMSDKDVKKACTEGPILFHYVLFRVGSVTGYEVLQPLSCTNGRWQAV